MLDRCVLPKYGIETIVPCWKVQQSNRADGTVRVPELLPWHRSPFARGHTVYNMPERCVLPEHGIETIVPCWEVQQPNGANDVVDVSKLLIRHGSLVSRVHKSE